MASDCLHPSTPVSMQAYRQQYVNTLLPDVYGAEVRWANARWGPGPRPRSSELHGREPAMAETAGAGQAGPPVGSDVTGVG